MIKSKSALEGFPYRLLIISVVLALTIPTVYTAWEHFDSRKTIQNIRSEVEFLGNKVEQVYIYGEGNSQVISLNLEEGMFTKNIYITMAKESDRDLVEWWAGEDYDGKYLLPRNIPLNNHQNSDDFIKLGSGDHELKLTCEFGELDGKKQQYVTITILS